MVNDAPQEVLLALLGRPLAAAGLDVEGVEVSHAGRRRLVRVLVDKDDGVTLDEVAAATRLVSDQLDGSDVLGDAPYTLELTSPGVDRPLTRPRHWRRNRGRLVTVATRGGGTVAGRVGACDESSVTLDSDGTPVTLGYAEVARALVEVEFNRPRRSAAKEDRPWTST